MPWEVEKTTTPREPTVRDNKSKVILPVRDFIYNTLKISTMTNSILSKSNKVFYSKQDHIFYILSIGYNYPSISYRKQQKKLLKYINKIK